MTSVMIRKTDQIMMSLVHYFVTKENYSPIHVQGVKDEVWLENLNGPYRVIRISSNSIINEEQYNFDVFKVKHVIKQIKKKTLSFKMNTLNIYLDMNKKVKVNNNDNIYNINVTSLNEVKKNPSLKAIFPDIDKELIEAHDGLELIINVTNDINEKTEKDNRLFAKVFSPKKIIFTNLIALICFIMYIILVIKSGNLLIFDADTLALLGANNLALVKSGEIWRLLTGAFLHGGLIHIVVNMYSLFILGTQVETFIGKWKFLFIYIVSAISGSLLSLVFAEPNVVSVGASGALFGLMGSLLYFGYHYRLYLSDAIKNQIIPIIIINLLIGFTVPRIDNVAHIIDNVAHIGGLIGGYLASMAFGIENKSEKRDMINGWIVLILYIAFLSYVVFFVR